MTLTHYEIVDYPIDIEHIQIFGYLMQAMDPQLDFLRSKKLKFNVKINKIN